MFVGLRLIALSFGHAMFYLKRWPDCHSEIFHWAARVLFFLEPPLQVRQPRQGGLRPSASRPPLVCSRWMESSSSEDRLLSRDQPLVVPAQGRLQFRCRLLCNTSLRWLNWILSPDLNGLLGSRRAAGLCLACLRRASVALLHCIKGALGQA